MRRDVTGGREIPLIDRAGVTSRIPAGAADDFYRTAIVIHTTRQEQTA